MDLGKKHWPLQRWQIGRGSCFPPLLAIRALFRPPDLQTDSGNLPLVLTSAPLRSTPLLLLPPCQPPFLPQKSSRRRYLSGLTRLRIFFGRNILSHVDVIVFRVAWNNLLGVIYVPPETSEELFFSLLKHQLFSTILNIFFLILEMYSLSPGSSGESEETNSWAWFTCREGSSTCCLILFISSSMLSMLARASALSKSNRA
jgi:hypothetical protein